MQVTTPLKPHGDYIRDHNEAYSEDMGWALAVILTSFLIGLVIGLAI